MTRGSARRPASPGVNVRRTQRSCRKYQYDRYPARPHTTRPAPPRCDCEDRRTFAPAQVATALDPEGPADPICHWESVVTDPKRQMPRAPCSPEASSVKKRVTLERGSQNSIFVSVDCRIPPNSSPETAVSIVVVRTDRPRPL